MKEKPQFTAKLIIYLVYSAHIYLLLVPFLLSGCEVAKWLESNPDDRRFAATVREEVERIGAEQATTRRQHIDQSIDRKFEAVSGPDKKRIAVIEQKIGVLVARMGILARHNKSTEKRRNFNYTTHIIGA